MELLKDQPNDLEDVTEKSNHDTGKDKDGMWEKFYQDGCTYV